VIYGFVFQNQIGLRWPCHCSPALNKFCLPFARCNQIYRAISIVAFMVFYFGKQQSLTGFQAIRPKRIKPATILWAIPHDQVYPWPPYENIGSVERGA